MTERRIDSVVLGALVAVTSMVISGCVSGAGTVLNEDVEEAFEKELPPQPKHQVKSGDGFFRAKIEGSGPPRIKAKEKHWIVTAPLDDRRIQCAVFKSELDIAELVRSYRENLVQSYPDSSNLAVGAGAVGSAAYLRTADLYRFRHKGEWVGGQMQVLAAIRPATTVACMMDSPGLVETFHRVASSFVSSMRTLAQERKPDPRYRAIHLSQRSDGEWAGFSEVELSKNKRGHWIDVRYDARLSKAAGNEVTHVDRVATRISSEEGELLEGNYVKVVDANMQYKLRLGSVSKPV